MGAVYTFTGQADYGSMFDLVPEDPMSDGQDLRTEVLIALFTDAARPADDPTETPVDGWPSRGGWWADPTLGSLLWTLCGQAATDALCRRVEEYAQAALASLVDEGVCEKTTSVSGRSGDIVTLDVTLYRGGETTTLRFADLWAAYNGRA